MQGELLFSDKKEERMENVETDNLDEIKKKLKDYKEDDIKFNEPHFSDQLMLREGKKEDVIRNILNHGAYFK